MSDLDKLKKKRAIIRQLMSKLIVKIESSLLEENIDKNKIDDLHDFKNQLIEKNDVLKSLDNEIETLLKVDAEFENEIVQSQEYQDRATTCRGKVDRYLNRFNSARSESVVIRKSEINNERNLSGNLINENNSYGANVVKLPKLEITKFYGDATNWLNFYNQFEKAIHNNMCLSKIEKFNYLKMYLGGNALSAVSGFSLSDENYDSCISLLKERFGRQDLIISSHMNKLLSIDSVKNSMNVKGLRKLYDECEIHIRSLQSLNVTAGSYGNLLCPVILQKLPEELNLEYNRKRKSNLEFDINELVEFIRKEVECREASQLLSNNSKGFSNNFEPQFKGKKDFQSKSNYQNKVTSASSLLMNSNNIYCVFCNTNLHESKKCPLSVDKRKLALRNQFRCFRCMKKNHVSKKCFSKMVCKLCNKFHNDLICDSNTTVLSNDKSNDVLPSVSASCVSKIEIKNPVLLHTALANLKCGRKNKLVRILYDSGSHRSFVKRSVCNALNLNSIKTERLHIYGFGNESSRESCYETVELPLENINNHKFRTKIEALIVSEITYGGVSPPDQTVHSLAERKKISLSDTGIVAGVDILIGADFLFDILFPSSVRLNKNLVATDSLFGFVVQGKFKVEENISSIIAYQAILCNTLEDVKLFFELESLGIDTKNEELIDSKSELMNTFKSNLKYEDNRYSVNLLWKHDTKHLLSNNFELASERFGRLLKRFRNDFKFFSEYKEVIKDYESQGIIERVTIDDCSKGDVQFYLPHRAVIRNDKSTSKVRIVFDASAHAKNELSLNDCLHVGPNLYPDLFKLILAFRENPIAFTADIKQAFLQIAIQEEDRDVTRFLWSDDPNNDSFSTIYRFRRVLFGINCSPFLLAATIKEHIKKYSETHPLTYELLDENVYVDDVIGGCSDVETALQTSLECIDIFQDAGMLLRKFQTNDIELRKLWTDAGIELQNGNETIGQSVFPFKVLGVCWDPDNDLLYFESGNLLQVIQTGECTKRFLLKVAGRVFDPVGFLGPFTLRLKFLIQTVWERKLDWDDKLTPDLEFKWKEICEDFGELDDLKIPRYYFSEIGNKTIKTCELHIFSDASLKGYGTVCYLRTETCEGLVFTTFVAAKGRVAPLRPLTLPRLELLGALLSARLSENVIRSIKRPLTAYFWCDSSIVCCWVKTPSINFKQFVRNRVKEIQSLTDSEHWYHCPGRDNPADLISRGASIKTLKSSILWRNGPVWLQQPKETWPVSEPKKIDEDEIEYRTVVNESIISEDNILLDISKFSNLHQVIRITAWVVRFINSLKKVVPESDTLTASELDYAENVWIKHAQREFFQAELRDLQKDVAISPHSSIFKLSPFLDSNGLIRIRSRLEEGDYTCDEKQPIIIPRKAKFAELVVKREHERMLHCGTEITLSKIRRKFWIPKGRQLVKKIISQCLVCRKYTAKPADQLTAQIPKDRISETPPFSVCGVDFTGPVYVKDEKNLNKAYIVLFTCAVTRAVHLELITDMSTTKFLLAFRRFLSRRGTCKIIYSDNAKSFKCANKEMKRLLDLIKDPEVKNFVATEGLTWKFIVERAPWWGGFYERLMKSIKEPLKKVLGKALLNFEEMTTILTEVETVINNRPLTYVSNESGEPSPLTPAQFLLCGRTNIDYPAHFVEMLDKVSAKELLCKRQRYQSKLLRQLWQKWRELYLLQLRTAHNSSTPTPKKNLEKDDVVLIEGTSKNKLLWQLGVIENVLHGRDGLVRSCIIRTNKGLLKRPVQLLYPLEI